MVFLLDALLGLAAFCHIMPELRKGSPRATQPSYMSDIDRQVYSEILVHPGLISAKEPSRVLLIAEPGSFAACEIAKHTKVQSVQLVTLSNTPVSASSYGCGTSPIVVPEVLSVSIFFHENGTCNRPAELYDVVIVDPLPRADVAPIALLVSSAVTCFLNAAGVAILPLGSPPDRYMALTGGTPTSSPRRALSMMNSLKLEIESLPQSERGGVNVYDTYLPPQWQITVAVVCLEQECSERFGFDEGPASFATARRLNRVAARNLAWFDGPTHSNLGVSRTWEILQCTIHPDHPQCSETYDFIDAPYATAGQDDLHDDPQAALIDVNGKVAALGDLPEGTRFGFAAATGMQLSNLQLFAMARMLNLTTSAGQPDFTALIGRTGYKCRSVSGEVRTYFDTGSRLTFFNDGDKNPFKNEVFDSADSQGQLWVSQLRRPTTRCMEVVVTG